MRRAALAAAFLGLIGTGLGCKATFGRCDCQNDPSCGPLPAYTNPSPVVGSTQTGAVVTNSTPTSTTPGTLPEMSIPVPTKDMDR